MRALTNLTEPIATPHSLSNRILHLFQLESRSLVPAIGNGKEVFGYC